MWTATYTVLHCPHEQEETIRLLHTIRGGSDSRRQQSPGGRASRGGGTTRAKGGENKLRNWVVVRSMQKTVLVTSISTATFAIRTHVAELRTIVSKCCKARMHLLL